jgi:ATP-binding cassette subfamily B protein
MRQIGRILARYRWLLCVVVLLLFVQAYCELALPGYNARIVNIGIQQGGIEMATPAAMREGKFNDLALLLTDEQEAKLSAAYTRVEAGDPAYAEEYPLSATQGILVLTKGTKTADISAINSFVAKATAIVQVLDNTDNPPYAKQVNGYLESTDPAIRDGLAGDWRAYLSGNPAREEIAAGLVSSLDGESADTIEQSVASEARAELVAIGVDVGSNQINYIIRAGLSMLLFSLVGVVTQISMSFFQSRISSGFGRDLRRKVFTKVLTYSSEEIESFSIGSLITRNTNDVQGIQMMAIMGLRTIIFSPIMATGAIINIIRTNASMSWIVVIAVVFSCTAMVSLFKKVTPRFVLVQQYTDRINLVMREILTGLPVIRAFAQAKSEEKRFDKANDDTRSNQLFINRMMGLMGPIMGLTMNGITVAVVWFGGQYVSSGRMMVGDIMAYISYTMQIVMSFQQIAMLSVELPRALVSLRRLGTVLDKDVSIKDPEVPAHADPDLAGRVEFVDVAFRYPDAEADVISKVSFVAEPGQTTAIIGSTGSGKSTLINLIPRFYDVTAGSILVGGVDVRSLTTHELRSKIGYVPQKSVLFTGTIESNIKFAGDVDDAGMEEAARVAQATEFIEAMPDRYEEVIAESGTNVSGGQKQRVSIARAVAKHPDIYIFDDSFSAVDYQTDVNLRKALKEEMAGATLIIVAQRISTIMTAEKIVVLDEGEVVGVGNHDELLDSCEVYYQIAESQLSEEELKR